MDHLLAKLPQTSNPMQSQTLPNEDRRFAAGAAPGVFGRLLGRTSRSLTLKWSLAVGLLTTLAVVLLGWISVSQQTQAFSKQRDQFGTAMAEQLAGTAGEPVLAEDSLTLSVMVQRLVDNPRVLGAAVLGKTQVAISAGVQPPPHWGTDAAQPARQTWRLTDDRGVSRELLSYHAPILFEDLIAGHALITLDAETLDRGLEGALRKLGVIILLLALVMVTVGILLTRRLFRPLRQLASASSALGRNESTRLPEGQRQDEIGRIMAAFDRLGDQLSEQQRTKSLLQRYVPATVTRHVLDDPAPSDLHSTSIEGSVLFCDVSDYTALSENLPAQEVVARLNEYFSSIAAAAHSCNGTVDSFSGDCAIILFGGTGPDPLHALHAATCAVLIRETVHHINRRRLAGGSTAVRFHLGVNSGPMVLCNLGGEKRMQHTVIGDTVNVASRLCNAAAPGEILVGEESVLQPQVAERLLLTSLPPRRVRGRQRLVASYKIESLTAEHERQLQRILEQIIPLANR